MTSPENSPCAGMLACVGDLMADILVTAAKPADGMADGIYIRSGGSAANVAVWARRAGMPSAWLGAVGTDAAADMLLTDLEIANVVAVPNFVAAAETGVVISRVGRHANRVMQSARGAASVALTTVQLDALQGATGIHLTGYTLIGADGLETAGRILETGRSSGACLSFDPSDRRIVEAAGVGSVRDLLRSFPMKVIFATRDEAVALTGERDPNQAANRLLELAEVAIVKAGGLGSILASRGSIQKISARRVKAIDTTGAGDAFAGTWLGHILMGADSKSAANLATRAAATVIQAVGARPPVGRGVNQERSTQ